MWQGTDVTPKRAVRRCRWPAVVVIGLLSFAGCGGGGGDAPPPVTSPVLTLLAGNPDGPGVTDGLRSAARFNAPWGVALDAAGNTYVADTSSHTIRKITPAGAVSTLAGTAGASGSADGTGAAARFYSPRGIAVDGTGNVYVADGASTIRKITPAGVVSTLAGRAGWRGFADGTGANALFASVLGLATDVAGNVYAADTTNFVIRRITPAGVVSTLAGTPGVAGDADGPGATASFRYPSALVVSASGEIYVGDTYSSYTIRRISAAGVVSTYAGAKGVPGTIDGPAASARFISPQGVALDATGNLYVADSYAIRKITPAGQVSTLAGEYDTRDSVDGTGEAAHFQYAIGIASDSAGNLVVSEQGGHSIRAITPAAVVTTLAGAAAQKGAADGQGAAARFYNPEGLTTDAAGNLYVADAMNCVVRKITPAGAVSTFAGTAGLWGWVDGTGAAARFWCPRGVAADGAGKVFVADDSNAVIRQITPDGTVSTLAGSVGLTGSTDGTGTAARFGGPTSMATDAAGNVYVADTYIHIVRKVTPSGVVTTLAGLAGQNGATDGTGSAARFRYPRGIAVDSSGNVYVGDSANYTVRKISPAGEVTTLAGTAGAYGTIDGTGSAARFSTIQGLAVSSSGNVYVSDKSAHTIRKITPAGVVSTVVGQPAIPGFAPGSAPGLIAQPTGIAVHGNTLYLVTSQAVASVSPLP